MLLGIAIGIGLALLFIHIIFEIQCAKFWHRQGWFYTPWFLVPLDLWVNRKLYFKKGKKVK